MQSLERHARERVGNVLPGGYTLLAVAGVGGAAAVYEARTADGATVAVKRLHPHLQTHDALVRRFRREAALVLRVNHPGVVPILAEGLDDGVPFLVMPFLRGETLEDLRAARGPLPMAEVATWVSALLEILGAAHAASVVHRDVKPANVFLETDGTLRLLDFGLAGRAFEAHDDDEDDDDALSLAEDGELLGTLAFMAPEQAAGRLCDVDARSDLFAVGALTLKLVSGLDAHDGATKHERLLNAATRPVPKTATRFRGASPALAAFLDRALAFHRSTRFSDAASMREALGTIGGDSGSAQAATVTLNPLRTGRTAAARVTRARLGLAVLAALAVLAVGLAALVAWGSWPAGTEGGGPAREHSTRAEDPRGHLAVTRDSLPRMDASPRRTPEARASGAAAASTSTTAPIPAPSVAALGGKPDPMDIRR